MSMKKTCPKCNEDMPSTASYCVCGAALGEAWRYDEKMEQLEEEYQAKQEMLFQVTIYDIVLCVVSWVSLLLWVVLSIVLAKWFALVLATILFLLMSLKTTKRVRQIEKEFYNVYCRQKRPWAVWCVLMLFFTPGYIWLAWLAEDDAKNMDEYEKKTAVTLSDERVLMRDRVRDVILLAVMTLLCMSALFA